MDGSFRVYPFHPSLCIGLLSPIFKRKHFTIHRNEKAPEIVLINADKKGKKRRDGKS